MIKIRKIFSGLIFFLILFAFTKDVKAANYKINNFHSNIELTQDRKLDITEEIEVEFTIPQHGIYRYLPYIYKQKDKTVFSKIKIINITDQNGKPINYTIENINQNKQIKIGDAQTTITGIHKYYINYIISSVVLDYGFGPEIYWNVAGSQWLSSMPKVSATVSSPYGKIIKTQCYGCDSNFTDKEANFNGSKGLTIVAQIDPINNLSPINFFEENLYKILLIISYAVSLIPITFMFLSWLKKGRDKKYQSDNIYTNQENSAQETVPLFNRPHLPLSYTPINGLTPSEVGAIIDEKVDTKDIIAEIVELARLGFFNIKKIEIKGLFSIKSSDYELIKNEKDNHQLNVFQTNLLDKLFDDNQSIKISELKNHFYTHLNSLREDLYNQLVSKKITEKNIDKVRLSWTLSTIFLNIVALCICFIISVNVLSAFSSIIILILAFIPCIIFARIMPRKTAWGYSLHRQAVGLKYYLNKGKWRQDIAEKNLFLEEMLPLAIALGVVDKLAKDMKDLGIETPKYFQGFTIATFSRDFNNFNSTLSTSLISSPTSNSSSWSGGSGFSGGGGGGGFGGGGGGSW